MGQVAVNAKTGKLVEAFSVTDIEWDVLCSAPKGSIVMPRSNWPAIPKTSTHGLRFFAHYPGYSGILPRPESYAHTRLKIDIVRTARKLGYRADIEVAGNTPDGDNWVADSLVSLPDGRKIAFEIQLSSQHIRDFRARTERYRRSSVGCCWVISETPVGKRLASSLISENIKHRGKDDEIQADDPNLLTFGVLLSTKETYPDQSPLLRFSRGPEIRRLSMAEAIGGMFRGRPQ